MVTLRSGKLAHVSGLPSHRPIFPIIHGEDPDPEEESAGGSESEDEEPKGSGEPEPTRRYVAEDKGPDLDGPPEITNQDWYVAHVAEETVMRQYLEATMDLVRPPPNTGQTPSYLRKESIAVKAVKRRKCRMHSAAASSAAGLAGLGAAAPIAPPLPPGLSYGTFLLGYICARRA